MRTPIEYIKEAWRIYTKKENFIFFARIMSVLVITSIAIKYLLNYFLPVGYPAASFDYMSNIPRVICFIVLTLISFIFYFYQQSTTYYAIFKMGNSEKEIFRLGYKNMWRFFLVSFVIGLIVLGGAILLVVPAIIFGIWYSFSIWLALDKNMGVVESLKTSKQMVNGKFWKVLGRLLVFGLLSLVISVVLTIVPYVGSLTALFVAPFFMLPHYLLYRDLRGGL